MTGPLDGKVAIVTGASRGIGEEIARAYARAGATVVITARKPQELDDAAARVEGDIHPLAGNAGQPETAAQTVATTLERFGRLDILVNNAATNPHMGPMIEADLPRWDKTFQVNLRGPFAWTQEAWGAWMKEHGGSVLNIASVGGLRAGGPIGVYNLTKAALIFMTRHLASELGPLVRVNALAPGLVKTEFARALWQSGEDSEWPWPLKRLGEPSDVASAALFLASEQASWITGAVLTVDGGGSIRGL
jgi:NAD(P)-dependent dehydrogenase (short-subunit alcohol dehydrogenase family)